MDGCLALQYADFEIDRIANTGIGYELAGQLAARTEYHVIIGSRSLEKGIKAVQDLQIRGISGSLEVLQLDVTDEDSIARAADFIRTQHGRLDALINNAGIAGLSSGSLRECMHECFATNAVGAALVGEAFAPLLLKSKGTPRLLNVSSASSSIEQTLGNPSEMHKQSKFLPYAASKTAMNMVSAFQANSLGASGKVFVWCPGFTVSNLSNMNTADMGATSAVDVAKYGVGIIDGERDNEANCFLKNVGQCPW